MERSQNCQNGDDQRPATKAKLILWTPPSRMFMMNRWPRTRTTSSRPDSRMNSQLRSSPLPRRAAGRRGERGLSSARDMSVTPNQVGDRALHHEVEAGDHHDDPD